MKIWLRFGFSHTIIVDKDSNFLGVFAKTAALLKINTHVLSGENHDPMIVERICRFLVKCLTVFCNERVDNRVALEGILMSLYAWNSAPVIGTDVPQSLSVTGQEFNFSIHFSTQQHQMLTFSPLKVSEYATDQASLLSCGRAIAPELMHAHRSWHREYIHVRRPNPRQYFIGDNVSAKRSTKFDKKWGLIGKFMDAFTGPWEITGSLKGSSYKLKNLETSKDGKQHSAYLSPYPDQLLPFIPVDGPDNVYGQLTNPIKENPYSNAGLKGFIPLEPHRETDAFLANPKEDNDHLSFPSLAERDAGLFDWNDG